MLGDAQITFTGNVAADPDLRVTPAGSAVASFTVAVTGRQQKTDGSWVDGSTAWYRCTVWRDHAENVAQSLRKGTRVVVTGRLSPREWETTEGEKRLSLDVEVDSVGPVLHWATATVTKRPPSTSTAATRTGVHAVA